MVEDRQRGLTHVAEGRQAPQSDPSLGGPSISGWIAITLLIILVGLRVVVSFSPQLWWATDPRFESAPSPNLGFGPAAAAIMDWLSVVALGLAVLDSMWRGRRVAWALVSLWLVGAGFAIYQGGIESESLRIGGHWIGAMAVGLAAMHLASNLACRRIVTAAALALLVALAGQGILQFIDHPRTVSDFLENRDKILLERGWEPGSIEAVQYEKRLEQREATGRFGLSNVYASVVMTLTILATGLATAALRRSGSVLAPVTVAILGLTALGLTFSKGAVVAMAGAIGGIATGWIVPKAPRKWSWVALLIVGAGVGAVAMRGWIGPPDSHEGERSLLFRWYYWQAAARMVAEQPVAGVGPGRFQDVYVVDKNPLNPEEVADPHNVFVAFIATLGLGGAAWSLVLLGMLWRTGIALAHSSPRDGQADVAAAPLPEQRQSTGPAAVALIAGGAIFSIEYAVMLFPFGAVGLLIAFIAGVVGAMGVAAWRGAIKGSDGRPVSFGRPLGAGLMAVAMLGPLVLRELGVWWLGAIGFVAMTAWAARSSLLVSQPMRVALFAAACAMLLHAQIEMSITNMMAGPLLLSVLGLAAAVESRPAARAPQWLALAGIVALAMVMTWTHVWTIGWQQRQLRAAYELARAGRNPIALLEGTQQDWSPNLQALRFTAHYIAEQQSADAALEYLEGIRERGLRPALVWNLDSGIAETAYRATDNRAYLRRAFESARKGLEFDPFNILAHVEAGDLAWELGDRTEAKQLYERALELHGLARLIPHKQLQEPHLTRVRQRIARSP
jgi:hypothetical protein